jgi:hypothetical protein
MIVIDKYKCFECEAPATEQHHVIPESFGGTKTVPLCSKCHCLVHGLGGRRDQVKELTTRGLNKKMSFDFHYVWWHHFKDDENFKDVEELAKDLEVSAHSIKNRINRLREMDTNFLEELVLPHIGEEYKGLSIFNLEPYDLTDNDILILQSNREMMLKNFEEGVAEAV